MDSASLSALIKVWVWVALVMVCLEAYLIVNKIWIRKHEPVVAESVSISAQLIAIATGIPFALLFVMETAYEGAIAEVVFLLVNVIMIAIGAGLWVEGHRNRGLISNLKRALRLEKDEVGALINSFVRPVGADQVLQILHDLALIDRRLGQREQQLIEGFADKWDIDLAQLDLHSSPGESSYERLRDRVDQYLRLSPPPEQARQLVDMLTSLVQIDREVTTEEALILRELQGQLAHYADDEDEPPFTVFIAPQSAAQTAALRETLPNLVPQQHLGGDVFAVGRYHSRRYAELVCGWYREMGFLTVRTNKQVEPG